MSTFFNKGNQRIQWQFQLPLDAKMMNEHFLGSLPLGIYTGFTLNVITSAAYQASIAPGVMEIKDDSNKTQIKCQTTSTYIISGVSASNPYIHAQYEWNDRVLNFCDFVGLSTAQGTSANKVSNYICLGKANFGASGYITSFDYTDRQPAIFPVKPNTNQIVGELYRILSAGPHIRIVNHPDLGLIEISARYTEPDHHRLEGLYDDDHKQYLLTNGTRELTADWNAGYWIMSAQGVGRVSADILHARDPDQLYVSGYTLPRYLAERTNEIVCAGTDVGITYDPVAPTLTISAGVRSAGEELNIPLRSGILGGKFSNSHSQTDGGIHTKYIDVEDRHVGGNFWKSVGIDTWGSDFRDYRYSFQGCGNGIFPLGYQSDTGYRPDISGTFAFSELWTYPGDAIYKTNTFVCMSEPDLGPQLGVYPLGPNAYGTNGRVVETSYPFGPIWTSATKQVGFPPYSSLSRQDTTYVHGNAVSFSLSNYGYIMGGISGGFTTPDFDDRHTRCERYNPNYDIWTRISDSPRDFYLAKDFEINGYGYVARQSFEYWNESWLYDPAIDIWKQRNNCNLNVEYGASRDVPAISGEEIGYPGSFAINGFGYCGGGQYAPSGYVPEEDSVTASNNWFQTRAFVEYSPSMDLWSIRTQVPVCGSQWGACDIAGLGYFIGSYDGEVGRETDGYQYSNVSFYEIPEIFRLGYIPKDQIAHRIQIGTYIDRKQVQAPISINTYCNGYIFKDPTNVDLVMYSHNIFTVPGISSYDNTYMMGREGAAWWLYNSYFSVTNDKPNSPNPPAKGLFDYKLSVGIPPFNSQPGSAASASSATSLRGYWTLRKTGLPIPRMSGASVSCNGFGWYLFGTSADSPSANEDDIYRYDDSSDFWLLADIDASRSKSQGIAVAGLGKIWHLGGGEDTPSNQLFAFDDTIMSITTKATMTTARTGPFSFVVNSLVYVLMGASADAPSANVIDLCERYNPTLNAWQTIASAPESRYLGASTNLNGNGFCVGGLSGTSYKAENYKYLPHRDVWTTRSSISTTRSDFPIIRLKGYLFAFGGYNGSDYGDSIRFNDELNAWDFTAPMSTERYAHGGFYVNDYGYSIGGYDGSDTLSTMEKLTMFVKPEQISVALYVHDHDRPYHGVQ
jgi:hypothetical protein